MRYHVCKQTRLYQGFPYAGYSSNDEPCDSDDLDEALALAADLQKRNPIGWNVYDSQTGKLVYGHNFHTS